MALIHQIFTFIVELCNSILDFCNAYSNVLATLIAFLGFFKFKKMYRKYKEKQKYYNMYIRPVKNKSTSQKIDACIDSMYNGASDIEVKSNE